MFQNLPELIEGPVRIYDVHEYTNAAAAVQKIKELYNESCTIISHAYDKLSEGDKSAASPREGCYPYVGIYINSADIKLTDAALSYGFVDAPGFYGTTLTHPDFFETYYEEQISLLLERYKKPVIVGRSEWPIPLAFVADFSKANLNESQIDQLRLNFEHPNLTRLNDHIVNHTYKPLVNSPRPLALFSGERVDFSLHRLHHYTGTSPEHFQNFILLTNYQRYLGEFIHFAEQKILEGDEYTALITPGDVVTSNPHFNALQSLGEPPLHLPQMPAYHLKRPDGNGITFINIGVGPTNAKNITDHLAVLRPHCWITLGHCAALRRNQNLGDYILAHGYVRDDGVLDDDLPLWVPVPPIAEVQIALQDAVIAVTGLQGMDAKLRLRTGTIYTTDNRNWELRSDEIYEKFNQSRAVALDMESATIAANGLRFRVPYGTLLCVSDKPIHGEIKLRGMANNFYRERVQQHLVIGLEAIRILRERGVSSLHSRKLRGFDEPAFR
jgi:AMP nucleosidase